MRPRYIFPFILILLLAMCGESQANIFLQLQKRLIALNSYNTAIKLYQERS
jgi:hypothetical protein